MGTLMKRFVTLVLTFALLNFQFGGTIVELSIINSAYAQDSNNNEPSQTTADQMSSAPTQGEQQAMSDGLNAEMEDLPEINETGTEGVDADGDGIPDEAGKGSTSPGGKSIYMTSQYVTLITMIGIAYIALTLIKNCPKTTVDIGVAIAAGVVFIAGELASIFMAKGEIDFQQQNYTIHKDGSVSGLQAAALQSQIDGYKAAKKNAMMRAIVDTVAAATFIAASVIAGSLYTAQRTAMTTLHAANPGLTTIANSTALSTCLGYCSAFCWCCSYCAAKFSSCQTGISLTTAKQVKLDAIWEMLQSSIPKDAEMKVIAGVTRAEFSALCWGPEEKLIVDFSVYTPPKTVKDALEIVNGTSCNPAITYGAMNQRNDSQNKYARARKPETDVLDVLGEHLNMDLTDTVIAQLDTEGGKNQMPNAGANLYKSFQTYEALGDFYHFKPTYKDEIDGADPDTYLKSYVLMDQKYRMLRGEVRTITLNEYDNFKEYFAPSKNSDIGKDLNDVLVTAMEKGIDLFNPTPEAKANMAGFGLAAVAIAFLVALIPGKWAVFDTYMVNPLHRMITWIVFSTFSTAAAAMNYKIADDMQKNIDELEKILKKLKNYHKGGAAETGVVDINMNTNTAGPQQIPNEKIQVAEDGKTFPCAVTNSDGSCKNIEDATGKPSNPFAGTDIQAPDFGVAGVVGQMALNAANGIQGNNSLSGATIDNLNGIAGKKGALSKQLLKIKEDINKLRKDSGMKSVDFDARANELANRFKANTLKTLKGRGLSGKGAIAQLYGAKADSYTGEALSKDKNLNNPNKLAAFKMPTFKTPSFKAPKIKMPKMNVEQPVAALEPANEAEALEEFEDTSADIVQDESASLWEILNFRYRKSAFPRLFKRKQQNLDN